MTFLLIYLIGVFFAMILIARSTMKEFDIITLGNIERTSPWHPRHQASQCLPTLHRRADRL